MDRRPVSEIRRSADGRIEAVGDPGKPWSPRHTADAIRDILEQGTVYFVPWADGDTELRVVGVQQGTPQLWCERRPNARVRGRGPGSCRAGNDLHDLPTAAP
ncbi:MAG: hypothetical protein QOI20_2215 [Acidimicrobiaceae bacterium]|nr:hypothetical protein [Acidimicrobiaceae bacterium]